MHGRLSFDGTIPLQEAYQLIDEAIRKNEAHEARIQSTLIALKSQRNELAYVSRLPPEVLCRIFAYVQRDNGSLRRILCYSKWTAVTYVSRYWRNVALDAPILWREPTFGSTRWLREAVKRSKQIGLIINILPPDKHHRRGFQFALEHLSRIVGLRIFDNTELDLWNCIRRGIASSGSAAAPREFLDIMVIDPERYPVTFRKIPKLDPHSTPLEDLPSVEFRCRSLHLEEYNFDSQSAQYFQKALTHLTIENNAVSPPTLNDFANALKEVPNLEYLHLLNMFPVDTQPSSLSSVDRIHFAHLRLLHVLSCSATDLASFFRLVTFTPDTSVRIGYEVLPFSSADIPCIFSALASSYSTKLGIPAFQMLTITNPQRATDYTLRFRFFTSTWSYGRPIYEAFDIEEIDEISANLNLKLEVHFYWQYDELPEWELPTPISKTMIMNMFGCGSLPLQDIRDIYLELVDDEFDGMRKKEIDSETILNTLGKLPQVFSFTTGNCSSRPFVDALELSLNAQDTASAGTSTVDQANKLVYFPKLATLCFYETRIIESDSESEPDPKALSLELLHRCHQRRSQYGAGIRIVNYVECFGQPRVGTEAIRFNLMMDISRPFTPPIFTGSQRIHQQRLASRLML